MTPLHLLHALAVGGLLSGAAVLLEAGLRGSGRPARGLWMLALVLTATAPFWGPALASGPPATVPAVPAVATDGPGAGATAPALAHRVASLVGTPLPGLPWLWLALACLGVAAVAGGLLRLERRASRWPRATVEGEEVSVSHDFGPALVGLRRPRTVVPRWVLGLARREVSLILAHERTHRTARDGALLAAGLLVAAACPWNPWVWLQFRRLRDAVEMDCDRRLLSAGVPLPTYARVLVLVRLRAAAVGGATAALVESSSSLERRLETMRGFPWTRRRVAVSGLAALGLVVLACETPAPSAVDVDAAKAEQEVALPAGTLKLRPANEVVETVGGVLLVVDGEVRPGASLSDLPRVVEVENIASIEVLKGEAARSVYGEAGEQGVIHITTKGAPHLELREIPVGEYEFQAREMPVDQSVAVSGRGTSFGTSVAEFEFQAREIPATEAEFVETPVATGVLRSVKERLHEAVEGRRGGGN